MCLIVKSWEKQENTDVQHGTYFLKTFKAAATANGRVTWGGKEQGEGTRRPASPLHFPVHSLNFGNM